MDNHREESKDDIIIEKRRRLVQRRQAYGEPAGKALFAFLAGLTYDLEPLAAGAGHIEKRRRLVQRRPIIKKTGEHLYVKVFSRLYSLLRFVFLQLGDFLFRKLPVLAKFQVFIQFKGSHRQALQIYDTLPNTFKHPFHLMEFPFSNGQFDI